MAKGFTNLMTENGISMDFTHQLRLKVTFPYVPGFDISGTVAKLGEGVTSLAVGDEVRRWKLINSGRNLPIFLEKVK